LPLADPQGANIVIQIPGVFVREPLSNPRLGKLQIRPEVPLQIFLPTTISIIFINIARGKK